MKQINELSVIDRNGFVLIKIIIKNSLIKNKVPLQRICRQYIIKLTKIWLIFKTILIKIKNSFSIHWWIILIIPYKNFLIYPKIDVTYYFI